MNQYLFIRAYILLFALFLISSLAVQAKPMKPLGYHFVDEPGSLVKRHFRDFAKAGESRAVLIDGLIDTVHRWRSLRKGAIIRITFDLGTDVNLSHLTLYRGRVGASFKGDLHVVRVLGLRGINSEKEFSLLTADSWEQANMAALQIKLTNKIARYVELEIYSPKKKPSFQLSEVVFEGKRLNSGKGMQNIPPVRPWIDCFGQYTRETWEGKVYTKDELVRQGKQDIEAAKSIPSFPYHHDKYGGLLGSGKQYGLTGNGYFKITQLKGKWWFVTPEGNLFFALGMDGMLNPRGSKFQASNADAYTQTCLKAAKNFYVNNLKLKYGDQYQKDWQRVSLYRIRSWNFNTLGKWSNKLAWQEGKMVVPFPYTVVLRLDKGVRMIPLSGGGHAVPDIYAKDFEQRVYQFLKNEINRKGLKNDPWLLGYMINNEEVWNWKLVKDIMALDADEWPVKRQLVMWLKQKYQDNFRKLAKRWKLPVTSYDALLKPIRLKRPRKKAKREMDAFVGLVADRYFKVVSETLKRIDPNHLYLGNSMGWLWSDDAVRAYGKYVDVASFDHYTEKFDHNYFEHFASLTNRPILVGEHGLSLPGKGLRVNVNAGDKEKRAKLYHDYISDLVKYPYMIGNFYYSYQDQDIAGKKGKFFKNRANGFVDVTDQVDETLAEAARKIHAKIFEIRRP